MAAIVTGKAKERRERDRCCAMVDGARTGGGGEGGKPKIRKTSGIDPNPTRDGVPADLEHLLINSEGSVPADKANQDGAHFREDGPGPEHGEREDADVS